MSRGTFAVQFDNTIVIPRRNIYCQALYALAQRMNRSADLRNGYWPNSERDAAIVNACHTRDSPESKAVRKMDFHVARIRGQWRYEPPKGHLHFKDIHAFTQQSQGSSRTVEWSKQYWKEMGCSGVEEIEPDENGVRQFVIQQSICQKNGWEYKAANPRIVIISAEPHAGETPRERRRRLAEERGYE